MNDPLLTVIMPVYNAEQYLKEAIESILQQTLPNFDFLIIDDGSVDTSIDIIKSYTDPRIRLVVNEKNVGISATLNKAIDLCNTELIARMDADDISYPDRLQKQYDYFRQNADCGLLATWTREVTTDREPLLTGSVNSKFLYYFLTFQCAIYHPSVMYKRSAVMAVGMYNTAYSEDFELWWQLSRNYKVACLHEVLLDYRVTEDSLCRNTKKTEYETAQYAQVVRNIHYYAGYDYQLETSEVECFRYHCEPLLQQNSVDAIIRCLDKLAFISNAILARENVNRMKPAIREAAIQHRNTIIDYCSEHMPYSQFAQLLARTGNWLRLSKYTARHLLNAVGKK